MKKCKVESQNSIESRNIQKLISECEKNNINSERIINILEEIRDTDVVEKNKKDVFTIIIKFILELFFFTYGISAILAAFFYNDIDLKTNAEFYYYKVLMFFIGLICILLAFGIKKERSRSFLVSIFSTMVALVALLISALK